MTVARDLQSSIHHVSLLSWAQRLKILKIFLEFFIYLFIHSWKSKLIQLGVGVRLPLNPQCLL